MCARMCARAYAHVFHTQLWAGRMGSGICPHSYILWEPDGVSSALPSCLLPSDSCPLLGGGGEASSRFDCRGTCSRMVNLTEEAPAGLCSAQQPVTLDLPYLSLSKAGTRALFHCCRVTHTLSVLSVSPEVGEECTL